MIYTMAQRPTPRRADWRRAVILGAVMTSVCLSTPSQAQDQNAAFVHGFNSNGASWQLAADRLKKEFKIAPQRPDLQWYAPYASQAADLNNRLANPTLMTMGHSNGGLISRQWNRVYNRNDRIATVGSLHQGAPLAESVLNGNIYVYGGTLAYSISDAVRYTTYWESQGVEWVVGYVALQSLYNIFNFGANFGQVMANNGFALGTGTGVAVPVLYDMSPYRSVILPELNAQANLDHEALTMWARVGIASTMSTAINQQFYALTPGNAGRWSRIRDIAWAGSIAAYEYYQYFISQNHPYYYQLHGGAWRWGVAALNIEDMDAVYCFMNGTLRQYVRFGIYGYIINCDGSDGVVPTASQYYPNGTRQYSVSPGPTHTMEKQDDRVIAQMRATFRDDFRIPARVAGEPMVLVLTPPSQTIVVGQVSTLTASSYDMNNTLLSGRPVSWQSTNPGVASVSGTSTYGSVTGLAPGSTLIIASDQGYADTTSITVTPANPLTSVTVSGPTSGYLYQYVRYTATPNGGVGPYNYYWTLDGVAQPGNTSSFEFEVSLPRHVIRVTVTDSRGMSVSGVKAFAATSGGKL